MSDRLGVGVVGLGVGEQHALAFAADPRCRVAALCDIDEEKLRGVASRLPPAKLYRNADELISDPDVQVVSVASYDDDHAAQIVRALQLGKHVFAEKPLCQNGQELASIVSAWQKSPGTVLSTNTLLRRSPRFRWLKGAITSGRLGTVYCIEADYIYGRLHKLTSGWRGEIPNYSVMLGGGVHVIDLALWLSEQRPAEVVAYGSSLGSAGSGFRGIDLVTALMRFESGLIAKISANFASHYPHFHRVTVYGTGGTFENLPAALSPSARLWEGRDGGPPPVEIDAPYPGVGKGELIPSFVDAILGGGEPEVTEKEAFAGIATCLAIDRSVAEGRPVRVDYDGF